MSFGYYLTHEQGTRTYHEMRRGDVSSFALNSRELIAKLTGGDVRTITIKLSEESDVPLTTFSKADEDWEYLRNRIVGNEEGNYSRLANQVVGHENFS